MEKCGKILTGGSFAVNDLFRDLTVGEALALNEAARRTCEYEITSQAEGK